MTDTVTCRDMDAFIAEVRKALEFDPDAVIETPDGLEVLASDFLEEWDRVKAAERAGLN
jgi:hypothetical protein